MAGPGKPGRPKKVSVTSRAAIAQAKMATLAVDNPALAARLAGNVHGMGTESIPMREPERWKTRWSNTLNNPNKFWELRHRKGWMPVTQDDLSVPMDQIGARISPDGYVVRGSDREHLEMAFKMDIDEYRLLEDAKTAANMRGIGSAKKVKADMAEAAAKQFGDEGGQFVHDMPGEVVDTLVGRG